MGKKDGPKILGFSRGKNNLTLLAEGSEVSFLFRDSLLLGENLPFVTGEMSRQIFFSKVDTFSQKLSALRWISLLSLK